MDTIHISSAGVPGSVTPEILAVIDAAVTAFLGRKARILSVKLAAGSQTSPDSWTAQGRDMVHGSHSLVQRKL